MRTRSELFAAWAELPRDYGVRNRLLQYSSRIGRSFERFLNQPVDFGAIQLTILTAAAFSAVVYHKPD